MAVVPSVENSDWRRQGTMNNSHAFNLREYLSGPPLRYGSLIGEKAFEAMATIKVCPMDTSRTCRFLRNREPTEF